MDRCCRRARGRGGRGDRGLWRPRARGTARSSRLWRQSSPSDWDGLRRAFGITCTMRWHCWGGCDGRPGAQRRASSSPRRCSLPGSSLFSGSLYAMTFASDAWRKLGAVTPLGGAGIPGGMGYPRDRGVAIQVERPTTRKKGRSRSSERLLPGEDDRAIRGCGHGGCQLQALVVAPLAAEATSSNRTPADR